MPIEEEPCARSEQGSRSATKSLATTPTKPYMDSVVPILKIVGQLWQSAAECTDLEALDQHIFDLVLPHFKAEKGLISAVGCEISASNTRNVDLLRTQHMNSTTWSRTDNTALLYQHAMLHGACLDTVMFSRDELDRSDFVQTYLKPEQIRSAGVMLWPSVQAGLGCMAVWKSSGDISPHQEQELQILSRYLAVIRDSVTRNPLRSAANFMSGLSKHQQLIVALVVRGRTNREIGDELGISPNTVRNHLVDLFQRAGVSSRAELAATGKLGAIANPVNYQDSQAPELLRRFLNK